MARGLYSNAEAARNVVAVLDGKQPERPSAAPERAAATNNSTLFSMLPPHDAIDGSHARGALCYGHVLDDMSLRCEVVSVFKPLGNGEYERKDHPGCGAVTRLDSRTGQRMFG